MTSFVDPATGDTLDYTYDDAGNEISKTDTTTGITWTYGYNNNNQITSATETNASSVTLETVVYEYDAFGNLLKETVTPYYGGSPCTSVITEFAMDGWNPAKAGSMGNSAFDTWAVMNGSGYLQTRNIQGNGIDQILARIDNNGNGASDPTGLYFDVTDKFGSVRDVLDNTPDDAPVAQISYDVWGNQLTTPSSYQGMYGWDGYDHDAAATGLYLVRGRVYDPQSQRWISQDPMGFDAGDSNLYRYVNNAPTNGTDPSGMYEMDVHYYLTYFLAAAAGIPKTDAKDIAFADQFTDDHPFSTPVPCRESIKSNLEAIRGITHLKENGVKFGEGRNFDARSELPANTFAENLLTPWQQRGLLFHFRTRSVIGRVEANSEASKDVVNLAIQQKNDTLMGIGLHIFQDSWSHAGFNCIAGHAARVHGPDRPDKHIGADGREISFREMMVNTYKQLVAFRDAAFAKEALKRAPIDQDVVAKIADVMFNAMQLTHKFRDATALTARIAVVTAEARSWGIVIPLYSLEKLSAQDFDQQKLGGNFEKTLKTVPSPVPKAP